MLDEEKVENRGGQKIDQKIDVQVVASIDSPEKIILLYILFYTTHRHHPLHRSDIHRTRQEHHRHTRLALNKTITEFNGNCA